MKKSFFPLTAYLSEHPIYGEVWNLIFEEFERTKKYILLLTGKSDLMANYPVDKLSIEMRERIVLPLLTIQQYALNQIRALEADLATPPSKNAYEKLVMRTSFGIINAGRNSA
jgi:phosphoenolpyruvate carboxylase